MQIEGATADGVIRTSTSGCWDNKQLHVSMTEYLARYERIRHMHSHRAKPVNDRRKILVHCRISNVVSQIQNNCSCLLFAGAQEDQHTGGKAVERYHTHDL